MQYYDITKEQMSEQELTTWLKVFLIV